MKRITSFLFCYFFISAIYSQDIGYRTVDIGGEYQWHKAGNIIGLHLALNAKIYHGIQVRVGYLNADHEQSGNHKEEKGSGWGGGLGYRYYFKPIPHKFFLGLRTDIWRKKIDWIDINSVATGTSKTWEIIPSLETGYLILINDQGFITPTLSAGYEVNIKTEGAETKRGFLLLAGISAGFRF